jgi:hypothetical protein
MLMRGSMMARLVLLGGIGLVTMGSQYSCSSGDGTGSISSGDDVGTFSSALTLRDSNGAARASFAFGQSITFELAVTNHSGDTVNLRLPTAQVFDFYVLDPGSLSPRWQWSYNRAFSQAFITVAFAPYQTRTYPFVWNGVLNDGTQIVPGTYEARGLLAYSQFAANLRAPNDLASPVLTFTVTP